MFFCCYYSCVGTLCLPLLFSISYQYLVVQKNNLGSRMALTEAEQARMLVGVHLWDLERGGQMRDYEIIRDITGVCVEFSNYKMGR